MPSPTTGLAIAEKALRLIGVLGSGEAASASDAIDTLSATNDIIETWNTEGLTIYASLTTPVLTAAGKSSYTVGQGGDWNVVRPIFVTNAYMTFSGVDFPVTPMTYEQYTAISLKTLQAAIIERYVYVNTFPLGTVFLYPTPNAVRTLNINLNQELDAIPSLASAVTLPPGYVRALTHAVALEIAPEFGMMPTPTLMKNAAEAKANIQKANRTPAVARFDRSLQTRRGVAWQRGY